MAAVSTRRRPDLVQRVEIVNEEKSAGGIVMGDEGLLMIKVKNLEGSVVWTFPKGHLEGQETAEEAARREVLEETGWSCRVTGLLGDVHYRFYRNGVPVRKTVSWFYMAPESRTGECDPEEVLDCRWAPLAEASTLVVYKSDRQILAMLKKKKEIGA